MKESSQKDKKFGKDYDDSSFLETFLRNICAKIFTFLHNKTMMMPCRG